VSANYAAVRGETAEQYAGGYAGRSAEIEAGAESSARRIGEDVMEWVTRLDTVFAGLADDVWSRPVRTVRGDDHPVATLPFRRWREVEVHMVDFELGFTHRDWSAAFVGRALPAMLDRLPERSDHRELMAWLLGRGLPPSLPPWG